MAWAPLRAGDMRSRVRIEAATRVSNGQGGYDTVWSPVATTPIVSAQKVPLRGDEITRDSIVRSVSVARFIIRHRGDISTGLRLFEVRIVGGTYEDIGGPWNIKRADDPFGRRDRLELDCEWISGLS